MKKYLLLQGLTESEWDSVSFVLIELRPELVSQIKRLVGKQSELKESDGIDALTIYADEAEFFTDVYELPERFEIEIIDDICTVIELTDEEYGELSTPEQDLRYGEMTISSTTIAFNSFGKHTGEKFWASVNHELLINLI